MRRRRQSKASLTRPIMATRYLNRFDSKHRSLYRKNYASALPMMNHHERSIRPHIYTHDSVHLISAFLLESSQNVVLESSSVSSIASLFARSTSGRDSARSHQHQDSSLAADRDLHNQQERYCARPSRSRRWGVDSLVWSELDHQWRYRFGEHGRCRCRQCKSERPFPPSPQCHPVSCDDCAAPGCSRPDRYWRSEPGFNFSQQIVYDLGASQFVRTCP